MSKPIIQVSTWPQSPTMGWAGTTTFGNITTTGVNLRGEVVSDNGSPITETGFVVYPQGNATYEIGWANVLQYVEWGTDNVIAVNPNNLTPWTNYCARPYAINAGGTSYGEEVCFTTASPTAPVLDNPTTDTSTAANLTETTVDLSTTSTFSDGGSPITDQWWTVYPQGQNESSASAVSQSSTASPYTFTGLTGSTNYCAKPYVTNAVGTTWGAEVCFTTASPVVPIDLSSVSLVANYSEWVPSTDSIQRTNFWTNRYFGPRQSSSWAYTVVDVATPTLTHTQTWNNYTWSSERHAFYDEPTWTYWESYAVLAGVSRIRWYNSSGAFIYWDDNQGHDWSIGGTLWIVASITVANGYVYMFIHNGTVRRVEIANTSNVVDINPWGNYGVDAMTADNGLVYARWPSGSIVVDPSTNTVLQQIWVWVLAWWFWDVRWWYWGCGTSFNNSVTVWYLNPDGTYNTNVWLPWFALVSLPITGSVTVWASSLQIYGGKAYVSTRSNDQGQQLFEIPIAWQTWFPLGSSLTPLVVDSSNASISWVILDQGKILYYYYDWARKLYVYS